MLFKRCRLYSLNKAKILAQQSSPPLSYLVPPATKTFDDDAWVRSLTEAQAIIADIPEERITHDQNEADPKKVRPIQMGELLRKSVPHKQCDKSVLVAKEERQELWTRHYLESKWTEKCFGMIEWGAVRNSASFLLPKHAAVARCKHRRCLKIAPQSKETLKVPQNAVWHWEW